MSFKKKSEEVATKQIKVDRVKMDKNGNPRFTLNVNGVDIYGCSFIEGEKNGKAFKFISFPNYKGTDGKYYNNAFVKLTDEEVNEIETTLHRILDAE